VRSRIARGSLRLRLALLTTGVFLTVGAALLTATYLLVAAALPRLTPLEALAAQEVQICKAQQAARAAAPARSNGIPIVQLPLSGPDCPQVLRQAARAGAVSDRSMTLRSLLRYSELGLLVTTVAAAAAAWTLSGRALRPLRQVTEIASRASRATLGERLVLASPEGELKELADTFDGMLDRLDSAFVAQERFVADASHELRTPLTALRAVIDVTLAKHRVTPDQLQAMGADLRTLLDEASDLVDALLVLSRSEARAMTTETIDLATVVDQALDRPPASPSSCPSRELSIERDLTATPMRADRILVQRGVANLVDNAVTHNDDRRWIRAATFAADGEVGVTIESTGRIIAASEADQLFQPFYRADARTGNGHGLGLAIVRSVALAHGGRCQATPRTDGGLSVSLALPTTPK
jgi:signal transduction histidine kinase